ncbi:SRPBCC family protein [Nakamurella sp. YIM 132087]|uniref:SRPBCC family protein n=1 Tax=Nakamurella alba TaxID=2665158 RepID=A0A7K1FJQ6_9ACTN|nr:SRPBCC family protein [Nakamurella alba]MTD13669.1 SRPBCC family protein [Nakamurella alba]
MTRVGASVQVEAPAERVFAAMVDLPSQSRWMLLTTLFPLAGEHPVPEVGSRMAALTGLGGAGVLDQMEVIAFRPPELWEVRHLGRLISGRGVFQVQDQGERCTVEWYEELELPFGPLGRLGWPLVRPAVRWGIAKSLRTLAAGVEDGSLPLASR